MSSGLPSTTVHYRPRRPVAGSPPASVPFLIGRIDGKGRRIIFVSEPGPPPFPGPWELRAIFTR